MKQLPSGTVTFLFTDVEESTRLLSQLGAEQYGSVLHEHRERLRRAFADGLEVDTQGDALFYAFARADDAIAAAVAGQRALDDLPVRIRIGLHTGQPTIVADSYIGLDVHRAARICGAAHGGQVLISQSTRELSGAETLDLGEHRLKDLTQPQRLHQLVAAGLTTEFPPLNTLENRPTNLPVQSTPLVGRITELRDIGGLISREDVRLVTLTGTGGSGKTRLALHAAAEAVEHFPNGVWLVSLEAVADSALLLSTIAQTLGVYESGDRSLQEAIVTRVRNQRLLLVLDNFEQLMDAAPSVSDLLGAAPQLSVLVTSRAPLRLAAEHVFPVPPLRLPDPAVLPPVDALSQYESVALFIARAQSVAPGFAVTNENAPSVAELCARLDGLPLAIELAAARIKLLPPQALLARLGQRLELLRGGPRDRPERQQTLRATLDWSFGLLDDEQQRLFAHLGVFAGGFRLDAAEAICDAGLDAIEALLEINLLRAEEQPDGEARFFMLETIRDYAVDQLEQRGESSDIRNAHARWYAAWIEQRTATRASGDLFGEWEVEDGEQENIRAALAWARESGDVDLELQLAGSAGLFWWPNRGVLTEGRRWLEEALSRSADADEGRRAAALLAAAGHAWRQGEPDRCGELAAEAEPIFERRGDTLLLAFTLVQRGIAAEWLGDREAENAFYMRAEQIFQNVGNMIGLHTVLNNRGYADLVAGDFEQGERRLRPLVEMGGAGDARFWALLNHGLALARLGRADEAVAEFERALRDNSASRGYNEIDFYALEGIATVAGERGDDVRAARLWGASHAIREATGWQLAPAERDFHEEVEAEVRARMGSDVFDLTWNEGRQLSVEQASELALGAE